MEAKTKESTVVWEDPPDAGMKYDWAGVADTLRAQPMVWGKVFDQDRTSLVVAIRQGSITPLMPSLGFEMRTSNNVRQPVRTCTLHMRYNPGLAHNGDGPEPAVVCGAPTKADTYCKLRTHHESGRCRWHRGG